MHAVLRVTIEHDSSVSCEDSDQPGHHLVFAQPEEGLGPQLSILK